MKRPQVICLTPVKNEAWILDRFLQCASLWADHILIADQGSDDGSREIACRYPKVTLLDNPSLNYDEQARQKLLIRAARRFPKPRLLIALDADEILTASFVESKDWQELLGALPGTVIYFRMANLSPDFRSYWVTYYDFPWGFMDDGTTHVGSDIHSPRLPVNPTAPRIVLKDPKVMHYQYADWDRMESKHRWYQCWERLTRPMKSSIGIYRQYHHMYAIPEDEFKPFPHEWFAGYEQRGIDMTTVEKSPVYWWDQEILHWFEEYCPAHFRREAVWDIDWAEIQRIVSAADNGAQFRDPRTRLEKVVHNWLKNSQRVHRRLDVRLLDKALTLLGW